MKYLDLKECVEAFGRGRKDDLDDLLQLGPKNALEKSYGPMEDIVVDCPIR